MAKLDPKFTEALVAWMREEHTSDEMIRKGAVMLLQLNRNRVLYQQICRTPSRMLKKLEYELNKHISIRLDGYTLADVQQLEKEFIPELTVAAQAAAEDGQIPFITMPASDGGTGSVSSKGKRPDHDLLPDDIKQLWEKNAERWKKIKATFELLKTLDAPCDRYEHVKVLKEAWYAYKKDMCAYDDFKATDNGGDDEGKQQRTEAELQMVDYAQSYLSRYLPQLIELAHEAQEPDFTEEKKAKLEDLRVKIQDRVNILLKAGVEMTDERKKDLASVDIAIELPADAEEAPAAEEEGKVENPAEKTPDAEGEKSE